MILQTTSSRWYCNLDLQHGDYAHWHQILVIKNRFSENSRDLFEFLMIRNFLNFETALLNL